MVTGKYLNATNQGKLYNFTFLTEVAIYFESSEYATGLSAYISAAKF